MLQDKLPRKTRSRLRDSQHRYGWISILLHWLTAIAVMVLWFIGNGIMAGDSTASIDARRSLHVSIAASVWLLLLFRIAWRYRSRHPFIRGQSTRIHRIAKIVHYTMLVTIAAMLISGPMLLWLDGKPIRIFGLLSIPGPFGTAEALREFAWFMHSTGALLLFWLVLVHIGGALKHLMFHSDDTIARMIWPGSKAEPRDTR